jgi:hypothetical protein
MGGNHMITLEEISSKCSHLPKRDDVEIVRLLSAGRTRSKERLIGIGTVLETLGMADGTAFLGFIESQTSLKYVWKLIERADLNMASPLVTQSLSDFVQAGVITQANANKLIALGVEPAPVTFAEVAKALEGKSWPI